MSNSNLDHKWTASVQATAGTNSAWVIVPSWVRDLVATAIPGGGGSCTVQHTTAPQEDVETSPGSVQAVAWDPGSVSVATSKAAMGAVTAVRIQAVGQTATLQLAGERRVR